MLSTGMLCKCCIRIACQTCCLLWLGVSDTNGVTFTHCCCACMGVQVSPEGQVLKVLLDPTGERVATASAATESHGRLFLGSIMGGEKAGFPGAATLRTAPSQALRLLRLWCEAKATDLMPASCSRASQWQPMKHVPRY